MAVGMAGDIGVGVNPTRGRGPVLRRRSKEARGGDGHGGRVGRDKVHLLLMGVVGGHVGDVRRVLVHGRLSGVWLQGLSDAVEVKFVGIPLAVHFGHNVFIIVVSEGPAQLVVIHVGLAFPLPPAPGHLIGVRHFELPVGPLPGDTAGVRAVGEELEEELPQLDLAAACRPGGNGRKQRAQPGKVSIPAPKTPGSSALSKKSFVSFHMLNLLLLAAPLAV